MTLLGVTVSTAQAANSPADRAADYLKSRPSKLHVSSSDSFHRGDVVTTKEGLSYVPYERSYKGLPVVGGDFVVVTKDGQVASTAVAQDETINVSTTPSLSAAQAAQTASSQVPGVNDVQSTDLVVDATADQPTLAYETIVTGQKGAMPSKLHVLTDAKTGEVISTRDEVVDGTGNSWMSGPVTIGTSGSGTSFSMTDAARPGISCRNSSSRAVLTGTDDVWGNSDGTNIETGCVDALFGVGKEWDMLGSWFGRSGINGSGGGFPIYVGLNDLNAYWDGTGVTIGHNQANQWISALDVVGHEFGHAIDSNTPGGQSGNGVSEATGDIFGALTEAYANEAVAYDPPDYTVGEEINLVGSGPIRYMYKPSLAGDPDCYSSSIPGAETHAAAGPLNHWFYLVAEGSAPAGKPASPTCNGAAVTGLGIQTAGKIFYNAMLTKTSGMTYLKYRTATLTAAKNLFPANCNAYNTVKAAWDAISVPAQAADPTCTIGAAVAVNNPGNQTSGLGTAVSLQMTATGGTGTYAWSATGLPVGLSINASTGLISGTPSSVGTYAAVITATSGGVNSSVTINWTISQQPVCASPGNKLGNPGFETATAPWTSTPNVIGAYAGQTAHGGTRFAWMNGYGTTHTDTLQQTVAIPAGCTNYSLSFWLHIDSAETTTTTQFDKLTVTLGANTVATYSNLNKAAGYQLRTINVAGFAGQTVVLKFTGTEDTSLQTSFVVDDTALNVS
ncbi:M4 family metallopeptidase [Solirubrobacter soli]|uniref:M4 family metallopeptidase n=1 Tax=Solirubrobacter soli TaxID=363832 RepID=UPI000563B924|nr:M4 family metallopeptidase [Solirubrobacter soli]